MPVLQTALHALLLQIVSHVALAFIYIMACVRIHAQLDMHPSMVNVSNVLLVALLVSAQLIVINAEVITH